MLAGQPNDQSTDYLEAAREIRGDVHPKDPTPRKLRNFVQLASAEMPAETCAEKQPMTEPRKEKQMMVTSIQLPKGRSVIGGSR